ncbi:hypothetical protein ASG29_06755 [Sphingomonas sp. Leaf412]|nr:hypothetical protein ASG29_06755 [Sphingomonas sp. Leaf412]
MPPDARVAAAERRAAARLDRDIADLLPGPGPALDERTRVTAVRLLERGIAAIERDLIAQVRDMALPNDFDAYARLKTAGVLREPALMAEVIAQARIAILDESLVAQRMPGSAPGFLVRLGEAGDRQVRAETLAYLVADNRQRVAGGELPLALHRRLSWWIVAVMRERTGAGSDRALAAAADRVLAARATRDDAATAAGRLAAAIDARPNEHVHVLIDTLLEGRIALFVAVLARALGIDAVEARAIVLDPEGDRLWLALRALSLPRAAMARIGWVLGEADAARDVEALPDTLEAIERVAPDEAAGALAMLALPAEFRDAIRTLGRAA